MVYFVFIYVMVLLLVIFGIPRLMFTKRHYHGIIRPQKSKYNPALHACQIPFWSKPVGTLYRCKHCGNVWRSTVDLYWVPASIDQWKSAGGAT